MRTATRLNDGELSLTDVLWAILNDRSSSSTAYAYHILMPPFILLTVTIALLQSPEAPPLSGMGVVVADAVIDSVFMLEIITRICVAPSKFVFFMNAYNVIDCIAACPLIVRASSGFAQLFHEDRN